jgi:hypothetical protein
LGGSEEEVKALLWKLMEKVLKKGEEGPGDRRKGGEKSLSGGSQG